MKLYVSEEDARILADLSDFEIVDYEVADSILILPGGLGSFHDLFRGIVDRKDIYLYNENLFYTPIIEKLYTLYEEGKERRVPSEYICIESEFPNIIKKMEEKKDEKINDGKTSKLL